MSRLRVGIIGCGKISSAHIEAWRKCDDFTVTGVFDVTTDLANKRAAEFSISTVHASLQDIIDACDVLDVCTPPHTHFAICRDVLLAGKHLLIEKPVVIELSHWEQLATIAKTSAGKMSVIHNLKFAQSTRRAHAWVEEGRIGDVLRISREFLTSPSTDRMLVGDTHWSHKLPGGRWFETMPHELYLTHWFAGALDLAAVAVTTTPSAPAGAPADEVALLLRGDRTLATVQFSAKCEMNRRAFTVQGTHGLIQVDILSDQATLIDSRDAQWKRAVGMPMLAAGQTLLHGLVDRAQYGLARVREHSPHYWAIRGFGEYVLGRGDAPTPLDEIDYVVRGCHQIGNAIDAAVAAQRAR